MSLPFKGEWLIASPWYRLTPIQIDKIVVSQGSSGSKNPSCPRNLGPRPGKKTLIFATDTYIVVICSCFVAKCVHRFGGDRDSLYFRLTRCSWWKYCCKSFNNSWRIDEKLIVAHVTKDSTVGGNQPHSPHALRRYYMTIVVFYIVSPCVTRIAAASNVLHPWRSVQSTVYVGWLTELVHIRSRCVCYNVDLGTLFWEKFRASRLPKCFYLWKIITSLSGHLFFDRSKKYSLIRKLRNFKVAKYLLPQPVMSPVSIGTPMGNASSDSYFYWIL